jgi:hypothetical protein
LNKKIEKKEECEPERAGDKVCLEWRDGKPAAQVGNIKI